MLAPLLGTIFFILLAVYAFQAVKTVIADIPNALKVSVKAVFWLAQLVLVAWFWYVIIKMGGDRKNMAWMTWMAYMVLLVVPQIVLVLPLAMEDLYRLGRSFVLWLSKLFTAEPITTDLDSRRKFISQLALGLAAIPFFSILYGITKGKYNYRIRKETLSFKDLPEAFDGFTLCQISDVHAGSFDNKERVEYGINLINEQGADVILFTGDMVNNTADELDPWQDVIAKLNAPYGKYSVLGNHDYGDYIDWPRMEDKGANLEDLKKRHREMGFRLLLNENEALEKDGQKISLVGVENWGLPPFVQYGDLDKALNGAEPFKVLLSHDPSHFDEQVCKRDEHIHLTLSGHTHGMQFGIEIPGIRWSPVKYKYPKWAGLYEKAQRYLYVNRGFGFLAFPGRVGIWPEITLIELKKA